MYQFVRFRIKQNIISSQKLIQIEVPEKIIFPKIRSLFKLILKGEEMRGYDSCSISKSLTHRRLIFWYSCLIQIILKPLMYLILLLLDISERHYLISLRGDNFRKDYKDLSTIKAFFPNLPFIALTATAPPHLLKRLKESLSLASDCKVVSVNPNRANIYLDKKPRLSNHYAHESYDQILAPIANKLAVQRENYPVKIVYFYLSLLLKS